MEIKAIDRVMKILSAKGIKAAQAERELQLGNGYIHNAKKSHSDLKEDTLKKFAEYLECTLNFLITGEEMEKREPGLLYTKAPAGRLPSRIKSDKLIDYYDVDFVAGDIELYEDNNTLTPAYQMDIPEFYGCKAFRTYNDSMATLIMPGNVLFGTKEEDWQSSLEFGRIYGIIRHDNRRHLKYIRKADNGKDKTQFLLKSYNSQAYDDFYLDKKKIKSIWLIHGWLNSTM